MRLCSKVFISAIVRIDSYSELPITRTFFSISLEGSSYRGSTVYKSGGGARRKIQIKP